MPARGVGPRRDSGAAGAASRGSKARSVGSEVEASRRRAPSRILGGPQGREAGTGGARGRNHPRISRG